MLRSSLAVAAAALLTACATPQAPVGMGATTLTKPGSSYAVMMTTLAPSDTFFPGADCLLCIAAASVANSKLTAHTKTLAPGELAKLNVEVAEALRKKGATVTVVDAFDIKSLPDAAKSAPNFARKDFSSLKAKYHVDKLLVIAVDATGFERRYATYIPSSDPKAKVGGVSYIVDLSTNAYEWYMPINVQKASDGAWDEPPTFPGLTNAYYQALEMTRDQVIKPLAQ
ncbi:hypothetical protein [Massilia sp. DWR3-1-1]|uniref:hypothetical protein n=1 Tax=Massilia sp. DWR3-1-1 TaxID=2804559 RepID=UPI003CFBB513